MKSVICLLNVLVIYHECVVQCASYVHDVQTEGFIKHLPYHVSLQSSHQLCELDLKAEPAEYRACTATSVRYVSQKQSEGEILNITLFPYTSCSYEYKRNTSSCARRHYTRGPKSQNSEINQYHKNDTGTVRFKKELEMEYVILIIIVEFIVLIVVWYTGKSLDFHESRNICPF